MIYLIANSAGVVFPQPVCAVIKLFFPSIILEILFPILLIIGYKTRFSALIMALFTLSVALIFHTNFDNQMELIIFLKDIAIAGGFLIIFANEPKNLTFDYFLKSKK